MADRIRQVLVVGGFQLNILAKREWWPLIFLPVWLAFWTLGGVMAMRWLLYPGPSTPRGFIALWLVGWAFGETWATYQWLWTAFGKEIVRINEGLLTIRRDVLGYGRNKAFPVGTIRDLRASGMFPSNSYWDNYLSQMKLGGGTVAFDYQGKTHRFGIQLAEPEAQKVVTELGAHLG